MTLTRSRHPFVMAMHPTTRGFAWVVFEGALAPYDWGISRTPTDKNVTSLKRAERLFNRFLPHTLVLEAFEEDDSKREPRIRELGASLVALARERGASVEIFNRAQVRAAFPKSGAYTREDIAAEVARQIDAFRHRLPARRKMWSAEDERLALFAAAALVLTRYRHDADALLRNVD